MADRFITLIPATMRILHLSVYSLFAACFMVALAPGASTRTEEVVQSTFEDFGGGKLSGLSLSNQGILRIGPGMELLASLDATVIWKSAVDAAGNLYLGTGNNGVVFKVDPAGEVSRLFEPEEILARALAVTPDGVVYVGTSPNGRVYRLVPGGRPEVYFDPPELYIWDLLLDSDGYLYVATGQRGRIYRLPPDFQPGASGEVWFETSRQHVTSMTLDNDGALLVGTAPRAYLYRVTGKNESSVLFNAGNAEISQIAVNNGRIYFTTFGQGREGRPSGRGSSGRAPVVPDIDESGRESGEDSPPERNMSVRRNRQKSGQPEPQSGLWRVDESGFVELLWGNEGVQIFSFAEGADGQWLIGSGKDGEVYAVSDASMWSLLQKASDGGEVSSILPAPEGGYFVLTSNPTRVYRLAGQPAADGEYISQVIDAGQISRWGRLRLLGLDPLSQNGLRWQTRSGNTPDPDDTWQEWLDPDDGRIASAPGRYLQYRVVFEDPRNGLRRVQVFYQYPNVAPVVEQVGIVPIGIEVTTSRSTQRAPSEISELFEGAKLGSRQQSMPRSEFRIIGGAEYITVGWRASDPNGDQLLFKVELRCLPDDPWAPLADELDAPVFTLNTRGFADGYYQIRVTASDSIDNPEGEGRTGSRLSEPFLIDNSPPEVRLLGRHGDADQYVLSFRASDKWSIISSAEFVHNGGSARQVVPDDGIFDNTEESFGVVLRNLRSGTHSVLIQVTDAAGNASVQAVSFELD